MRSDIVRWLAVMILAPLVAMGALGGTTFLVHGHDDHGMHVHPVGALDAGKVAVADHAQHHGHEHASMPSDSSAPSNGDEERNLEGEAPDGVIIALDDHEQLPTRSIDLAKHLSPAVMFAVAVLTPPPSPDLDRHLGSPGGGPMDLMAMCAGDRLVRTSRALLI